MNCACNRYVTCKDCRDDYKKMLGREQRYKEIIEELECLSKESHNPIGIPARFAYETAVLLLKEVDKR